MVGGTKMFKQITEFMKDEKAVIADLLIGIAIAVFVVDLLMSSIIYNSNNGIYGTIRNALLPLVLLGGVVGVLMRVMGFSI